MKREFSAGGIVFSKEGKVLLICNASMQDPIKAYWGFPKGHLEEKESSQEAALREVEEETGLQVETVGKIGDSRYVFTFEGEKVFKVVTMFLMSCQDCELKIQAGEILEAGWFAPEEALRKLSFSNDKKLLQKALEAYGKQ